MNADEIQALLDAKNLENEAAANQQSAAGIAVLNDPSEADDDFSTASSDDDTIQDHEPAMADMQDPIASIGDHDSVGSQKLEIVQEPDEAEEQVSQRADRANESESIRAVTTSTSSLWIRLSAVAGLVLALAATTIGLINRSVLGTRLDQLSSQNEDLVQRCLHNQSAFQLLLGNSADPDRPFWNTRAHMLDLDREFFAQVPTQMGAVNVIRVRPTSLNERLQLHFEITNPNAITLHRGQLIIRSSSQPHDPTSEYDYDALRRWHKTLETKVYEIGDLAPGQTHKLDASAIHSADEQEGPEYLDFEVTFGYYSAT